MPSNNQINLPAGYAPAFAIGFSDQAGLLSIVDTAKPLPVMISADQTISVQTVSVAAPAALQGQTSASILAGPFSPVTGRGIILTLGGVWEGGVQVQRSIDGGITQHKLSAAGLPWGNYSANVCEVVWAEEEDGAQLYLDITITSGTLDYRIAQ